MENFIHSSIPCTYNIVKNTGECWANFFWRDLNKYQFIPGRALSTEQSNSFKVQICDQISEFTELIFRVLWRGYLTISVHDPKIATSLQSLFANGYLTSFSLPLAFPKITCIWRRTEVMAVVSAEGPMVLFFLLLIGYMNSFITISIDQIITMLFCSINCCDYQE